MKYSPNFFVTQMIPSAFLSCSPYPACLRGWQRSSFLGSIFAEDIPARILLDFLSDRTQYFFCRKRAVFISGASPSLSKPCSITFTKFNRRLHYDSQASYDGRADRRGKPRKRWRECPTGQTHRLHSENHDGKLLHSGWERGERDGKTVRRGRRL